MDRALKQFDDPEEKQYGIHFLMLVRFGSKCWMAEGRVVKPLGWITNRRIEGKTAVETLNNLYKELKLLNK